MRASTDAPLSAAGNGAARAAQAPSPAMTMQEQTAVAAAAADDGVPPIGTATKTGAPTSASKPALSISLPSLSVPRMPTWPAKARPRTPRLFTTVAMAAALLLLLKGADLILGTPLVDRASAQSLLGPEPPKIVKHPSVNPGETEIYVESAGRETPEQTPTNPLDQASTEEVLTERIAERRRLLEEREREMEMRESLLKAAEARIEERIGSLRAMELQAGDASAGDGSPAPDADMDRIVTMYEAMKAKEAARILSALDMGVLENVARRMNPRKLADIMGEMDAEPATRLTVRLAGASGAGQSAPADGIPADLPRIQGSQPAN